MPPTNPGLVPATPGGVREAQVTALENTHKQNLQEYYEHKTVSKSLMQKLISTFKPQYLRHLQNPHTGFNNTTGKVALKNLHDTYGTVKAHDLDSNTENMKTSWNKDETLENVFE